MGFAPGPSAFILTADHGTETKDAPTIDPIRMTPEHERATDENAVAGALSMDALPVPAAVVSPDGSIRVNRAFDGLRLWGADDAPGDDDAMVAVLSAAAASAARRFAAFEPASLVVDVTDRDGAPRRLRVTATPRRDASHTSAGTLCVVTPAPGDGAVGESGDALAELTSDGVVAWAAGATPELFGAPPVHLEGHRLVDLALPDDRPELDEVLRRAVAGSASLEVTFRVRRPDHTVVWIEAVVRRTGPGDGVVCSLRDATLRVAALENAATRVQRAEQEAREQDALRRVAMAVAIESDASAALRMVADEVSRLIRSDVALVLHFPVPEQAVVHAVGGASTVVTGTHMPLDAGDVLPRMMATGRTTRGRDFALGGLHDEADGASAVAAPVQVDGALWGAVVAVGRRGRAVPLGTEARLERFAELASVAIVAAETRTRLATQALTDPLTGLANHRSFHERLRDEVARAHRYERPLALALVDLDHFKRFNDTYGHQAGDKVLGDVARLLSGTARRTELVARVGGEEFAWLLPETGADVAREALDRARSLMSATPMWGDERMTFSAGVCDLTHADDGDELYRHADGALYWAKGNGRNQTCVYSPHLVHAMSPKERARRLERTRSVAALRSLARAIDAKDTATNRHSVRVAAMAQRVAVALGWTKERARELRDAALLHDIGKLGVPDSILRKEGPLDPAEYDVVKRHAALGAEITSDVLDREQCRWVRHHHERWDGAGYPDGLAGDQIPEGARIIAVADAWDVMTSARSYGDVKDVAAALAEVERVTGTQFWEPAARALERVVLGPPGLREPPPA